MQRLDDDFAFKVTREQHEWVRRAAHERRQSMGAVIRDLIDRARSQQARRNARETPVIKAGRRQD